MQNETTKYKVINNSREESSDMRKAHDNALLFTAMHEYIHKAILLKTKAKNHLKNEEVTELNEQQEKISPLHQDNDYDSDYDNSSND